MKLNFTIIIVYTHIYTITVLVVAKYVNLYALDILQTSILNTFIFTILHDFQLYTEIYI